MNKCNLKNANFDIIDNVVDDFFIKIIIKSKTKFFNLYTYLASMKNLKNVCGILRAIKELSNINKEFKITFLGFGKDWQMAVDYATELNIDKNLYEFVGEKSPNEVCSYLNKSDAFILFSNYETASVVIPEALAVGLPIISTDVDGIPNMMDEDCGFIIEPQDEKALVEKMNFMIRNKNYFSTEIIKSHSHRFKYDAVGAKLYECYKRILN